MKKIFYGISAVMLILTSGCKKEKTPHGVELRIFNSTPWTFYNCTIDPAGTLSDEPGINAYNFGQVIGLRKSSYKSFSALYHYAWIRLTMNSKTYYLKPYDYFGETPLPAGFYTYKLGYESTSDNLALELIHE